MKTICLSMVLLVVSTGISAAQEENHRPPAVAGMWYAASPTALRQQVEDLLAKGNVKALRRPGEPPVALVVPHAGYEFSGKVAAAGFASVRGGDWKRVILLGPSHQAWFRGASIDAVAAYDTPLGPVALDRAACDGLLGKPLFQSHPTASKREHDLECQLPFLQVIQPKARIVPVLLGEMSVPEMDSIAGNLSALMDRETLLVVSSDFTHFGPSYGFTPFATDVPDRLKKWNMAAAEAIAGLDFSRFWEHVRTTGDTICGRTPIAVAIKTMQILAKKKKIRGDVLDYTTSGAILGNWTNSVSYISLLFTDPPRLPGNEPQAKNPKEFALSKTEKSTLLRLARKTIENHFAGAEPPAAGGPEFPLTPILKTPCGAFVTLTKQGRLRGCIGYVVPVVPLYQAVEEMAINAAVHDYRFPPVVVDELKEIQIEISVLSPLALCKDLNAIRVGQHGLFIQRGGRSGLLLPQVAVEWGWDRQTFLEQVCRKAGLPEDAYKQSDAVLQTFMAEVFHEGK